MILRKVDAAKDAADIAEIYNHYVLMTDVSFETAAISVKEMAERIKEVTEIGPWFVIEEDGKVKAYAYAHPWKMRRAYAMTAETSVYVDKDSFNRGYGKALMERVIGACRGYDFHALIACITATNDRSIEFHRSLGFVEVSHFKEVGYKFGCLLDVIDMELILG